MEEEFRYDRFAPKQFTIDQEKRDRERKLQTGQALEEEYIELELLTSGEHAEFDLLYQLCGRKYQGQQKVETFQELVRPDTYYLLSKEEAERKEDYCIVDGGPVYYMDKYMCSMTGITNQMLFEARAQKEVLQDFRAFLGETRLIGKELSWQIPFLNVLLEEVNLPIIEIESSSPVTYRANAEGWSLEGKVCVFTGTLTRMVRGQAMQLVRSVGGITGSSITKKTDVLILGNKEEEARIRGLKSTKLRKAERLIEEGSGLRLLSEDEFYKIVGYKI